MESERNDISERMVGWSKEPPRVDNSSRSVRFLLGVRSEARGVARGVGRTDLIYSSSPYLSLRFKGEPYTN